MRLGGRLALLRAAGWIDVEGEPPGEPIC